MGTALKNPVKKLMTNVRETRGRRGAGRSAAFLAALSLALGCTSNGAEDAELQVHHPNGTVLTVIGLQLADDHIAVDIAVTNGSPRTIHLAAADDLVLLDDLGNRYRLAPPAPDPTVSVRSGATLEGQLVFLGRLNRNARVLMLVTNERRGSETWDETPAPRLRLEIPVRYFLQSDERRERELQGSTSPEPSKSRLAARHLSVSELHVREVPGGLLIGMQSDLLFEFGRHDLQPESRELLANLARMLSQHPAATVEILGHTDSVGTDAHNQILSERRAEAVRDYLVEEFRLESRRFTTIGYGAERPAAPNTQHDGSDHPDGRRLNRRVEILVYTEDPE